MLAPGQRWFDGKLQDNTNLFEDRFRRQGFGAALFLISELNGYWPSGMQLRHRYSRRPGLLSLVSSPP
jgi:hypothetical protein